MNKFLSLILIVLTVSSCASGRTIDVKSPCVSNEDGPCGPKRPVNDWWLKKEQQKNNS